MSEPRINMDELMAQLATMPAGRRQWTEDEEETLRRTYRLANAKRGGIHALSEAIGRTPPAIRQKAALMGL